MHRILEGVIRRPVAGRRVAFSGLVLGIVMSLVGAGVAFADNVHNDVVADVNDTFVAGGGSAEVKYRISATANDGQNNCNADDATPATLTIHAPVGVTATPSSLVFSGQPGNQTTACGVNKAQAVVFTSNTPGNYQITVSVVDNGTGSYNPSPATFTLKVLAPPPPPPTDTTPPVITPTVVGTLGNNGWYTSDVTVSWTASDPESAVSSTTGCGTSTVSTDTAGQTFTCTATSSGGTNSASVTVKRDATAPTISGSASPGPNANGWNNTDVAVSFACADTMSGIASCGPNQTLSAEAAGQSASGTAVDNAGNTADDTVSGINIDKTAPAVTASASPDPNGNGWNNSAVTVSFSGTDALSGIDSCDPDVVLSSQGAGQSATGSCRDEAGNSASATASGINIDLTPPSVTLVGGPADGGVYYFGAVPGPPGCIVSDAPSGVLSPPGCVVTGYSNAVGSHTIMAKADDNAGNTTAVQVSYRVDPWSVYGFYRPVDMGYLNTVKGGSTVPLKFEAFAGATELTDVAVVKSLSAALVTCGTGLETAPVEELAPTGGTMLRYDWTDGQFVFNWKTPKMPGKCYKVTLLFQDGSTIVAHFSLK